MKRLLFIWGFFLSTTMAFGVAELPANTHTEVKAPSVDTDDDGLTDAEELQLKTDPESCDTDQDGLGDGLELGKIRPNAKRPECNGLQIAGSNFYNLRILDPTRADSDGDKLLDGEEDINFNGWIDFNETDPTAPDTDEDFLSDNLERSLDKNNDGRADVSLRELSNGSGCSPPPDKTDLDCDGYINGVDEDSDGDGCLDAEEGKADRNDNGILDAWESGVKNCGGSSAGNSGSGGSSEVSAAPSFNNAAGVEKSDSAEELSPFPSEGLSTKGGGACQLIDFEGGTISGGKGCGILIGFFLLVLGIARKTV